jgi:SpoVK/Ycf46/Vps4 family AAA+-type ATPase
MDSLARTLSGHTTQVTGAHVESLCRRAVVMRIREEATKTTEGEGPPSISMGNFIDALHEMCPPAVVALPTTTSLPNPFEWTGTGFVEGFNPHPR